MTTPTQSGPTTPKKQEADGSATGGDDAQSQAQKSKQQLKGAELKLLLGAMSPEEVDVSGPRARRQQRKAPSLYDPGDMAGDMHWSSKKEAEARSGQRAPVPPGSKKNKRELLSDVFGKSKKSKSSASGEKSPKKSRTSTSKAGKKKKAKTPAKQKKKVCCDLAIEFSCFIFCSSSDPPFDNALCSLFRQITSTEKEEEEEAVQTQGHEEGQGPSTAQREGGCKLRHVL